MVTEYSKYEPLFGSWHIEKLLGEGSYGKVYEIQRQDFGVTYTAALKAITIPKSQSEVNSVLADGMDEESVSMYFRSFAQEFTNEFALMDKVKGYSNIVSYEDHAVFEHKDDIGWDILIRMELLTPLTVYQREHEMQVEDIIRLGIDLSKALEICGTHNIIHRDIKPENVFVSNAGTFKLGDFGIARVAEKTSGASTKVGTQSYIAPEIIRGEKYNAKVDIYSLGLMLYKFLNNNRLPFLPAPPAPISFADREASNARRFKGEALPSPANADPELARIVLKATAFNPADRYANATQLRAELEHYLQTRRNAGIPATPFVVNPQSPQVQQAAESTVGLVPGFEERKVAPKYEATEIMSTQEVYGGQVRPAAQVVAPQIPVAAQMPVTEKKPKKRIGLFIGIGAVAAILVAGVGTALFLTLGSRVGETIVSDSETKTTSDEKTDKVTTSDETSVTTTDSESDESIVSQSVAADEDVSDKADIPEIWDDKYAHLDAQTVVVANNQIKAHFGDGWEITEIPEYDDPDTYLVEAFKDNKKTEYRLMYSTYASEQAFVEYYSDESNLLVSYHEDYVPHVVDRFEVEVLGESRTAFVVETPPWELDGTQFDGCYYLTTWFDYNGRAFVIMAFSYEGADDAIAEFDTVDITPYK